MLDFVFASTNTSPDRGKLKTDLLTTKITTALVSSRRFDVVERAALDTILNEQRFSRTHLADPRQAAAVGKILGAHYVVLGEISVMDVRSRKSMVPYVETWKAEISGTLVLDFRVVDVASSKIERAAKVEASLRQVVPLAGSSDSAEPGELFYEDLQRDAAEKTAARLVSSLFPVKVSHFDAAGIAYLNVGEGTGIGVGDLFIVQETGEEIFDPDTGDSLGVTERPVAAIEVTAVEERRSKARLIGGSSHLIAGMICRPSGREEVDMLVGSNNRQ